MDEKEKETEKKPKRKMRLWIKVLMVVLILFLGILTYARFIGTSGLVTKEYLVVNENLPESFYGLKIAHITDLHYGVTTNQKEIQNLVKKVNETKPDIIVLTGDLLDKDQKYSREQLDFLEEELSQLDATMAKYAIMGNHDSVHEDYYSIISNAGFTNLDDSYEILYHGDDIPIVIAGASTEKIGSENFEDKVEDAIQKIEEIKSPYNILLMHEPDFIEEIDASKFQLVLAGHSHNGQVRLPFIGAIILPPHARKYYENYYRLQDTDFYISSGIGTSNVKFRWFNRPSFNLYRLVNQ